MNSNLECGKCGRTTYRCECSTVHVPHRPARVIELGLVRNDADMLTVGGKYVGSNTSIAPCACVHQAVWSATRGKSLASDVVLLRNHRGEIVGELPECRVSESHWTWQHHGFTHRARFTLAK